MNGVHDVDVPMLRALAALLAERNVTRAARSLGLTQSALSHMLGRLRATFDDPLFVRTPRGVLPTERALALAEPTTRLLGELERLTAREGPFDPRRLRRTLTLAMLDYGETIALPPLRERLQREAPGVDLVARPLPPDLEGALASGAVDMALGVFGELPARVMRRRAFDDGFIGAVRRAHPLLRRRRGPTVEEYVAYDHVLISPGGGTRGPVDDALAQRGLARRVAVRTANFLPALLLAARSDLVLTLPSKLGRMLGPRLGLALFDPPLQIPRFTVWQVWHERVDPDPTHAWLRRLLVEVIGAEPV